MKYLKYYMGLDYKVNIVPDLDYDGSIYFIASYEELEGLAGTGNSEHKALSDLEDEKEGWFELNIKLGRPIPEPDSYALNQ